MFQHVIIGQHVPGTSFLHRMDARAKILAIFILVLVIFLANNWLAYGILVGFAIMLIVLSRIPIRFVYKGLKPIFILVLITFIFHLLINKEGQVLYQAGPFTIYESGFRQGAFIAIRILVLVMMTSLLTLTTTPIDLTDGLESILSPFKTVGLPAHELALMMSIALRFIPTLIQEMEKIVKAQMARGSDFSSGKLVNRMKAAIPLLIPLFISSFKRAEDLALAMESRGYRGGEGRTKYRIHHWRFIDTIALIVALLFGVLLFVLRT